MINSLFQSSQDSSQISLMWSSGVKVLISVAVFFIAKNGFDPVTATNALQQLFDVVATLVPAGVALYHGWYMMYGIVRKMFVVKSAS